MVAAESAQELELGDSGPSFELTGTDGGTYTLDSFADHGALLLVFTCNHCPYAEAKEPALNAIAAKYDEVAVVGVNPNDAEQYPDDSFERMQAYVESGRIQYDAYLRDESQEVARAYGAQCTPDPFLFVNHEGADGTEWHLKYHGRLDDALNPDAEPSGEPGFEMREITDQVLAGEKVTKEFRPSRGCSIKWRD
jgi:peroxiredoxin